MMNMYCYEDSSIYALPGVICLVSETDSSLRRELAPALRSRYTIQLMSPGDLLCLSDQDIESVLDSVVVTLIDWNHQGPASLLTLKEVAQRRRVPVLVLHCSSEAEQVAALVLGADEALASPLDPTQLEARLIAYRRRDRASVWEPLASTGDGEHTRANLLVASSLHIPEDHDVTITGVLMIDRSSRRFYVQGKPISLSPRGFDLISCLIDQMGVCVSRQELLEQVWGIEYDTETNVVDVQIYELRNKLRPYGGQHFIQTVRGVGYRFVEPTLSEAYISSRC